MKYIEVNVGTFSESIPITSHPSNPCNQHNKGFVYFVTDGDAVKIGKAVDVKQRISSIKVNNPREIIELQSIPTSDMGQIERSLHEWFDNYHIRGEWFDLLPLFELDKATLKGE
jgi:hypothetical protein